MTTKKQIFAIRLRPATIEEIKRKAEENQRTPSDYARLIIENFLNTK